MKVVLLAASLVVVYAQAPTYAPTPAPTLDPISYPKELEDGQTRCSCEPGWNPKCDGDKKEEVCEWTHECSEQYNKTFSFCIQKGNIVCYQYSWLGTFGSIVDAQEHHPSKSCCDKDACNSRQTCVEMNRGSGEFEYGFADNGEGGGLALRRWSVEEVARNGWKNKKGEDFVNKPKMCIDKVFDTTQRTKQVIAPAVSMVVILIAIVLLVRSPHAGKLLPLLVLGSGGFLTLSEGWIFAVFTALVAVATVFTSTAHQGKLVLFLLAYVWLYFGGVLFYTFPFGDANMPVLKNYFLHATSKSITDLEGSCNAYFGGYFSLLDDSAWDTDETYTTYGLCGRWWIGFLISIAYFQTFALLLMVFLKVLSFLDPTFVLRLPQKMADVRGQQAAVVPVEKAPPEA